MELTPYLESLRRDLSGTAAAGTADVARAAELLAGTLEPSARLSLMAALSDAAAEITTKLSNASVEVRLRGREADLVVTELPPDDLQASTPDTAPIGPPTDATGEPARITLRLPERLKEAVERRAAGDGVSVNAWLVRAVSDAVASGPGQPNRSVPGRTNFGRQITGFAQA